jgi:predicted nucleic acid-binding protein
VIVIYAIEGNPLFRARADARLATLRAAGDQPAISDLTRLECRIGPIRSGDTALLAAFDAFFAAPDVMQVALSSNVYDRATLIRAIYNYKLADALHLAAAIEGGCGSFLTNDVRLSTFPDIPVEVLP